MERTTWFIDNGPKFSSLNNDITVDTAIIGGGITGVAISYFLGRAGLKTAIVEQDLLGSGATGQTTAFITYEIDTDVSDLVKMYGRDNAKLIWDSGRQAIDLIERVVTEEKIECEFVRCPGYIFANKEEEVESLDENFLTASEIGYTTLINTDSGIKFKNSGYWKIPNQAKFHPVKYLDALAKIIQKDGGLIFEKTKALGVESEDPFVIRTPNGKVRSKYLISAAYRPFDEPLTTFFKKGMYTSYVLEARIPKDSIEEAIYWDLENPYNYVRVDKMKSYDRLILGGEDHRDELAIPARKNYKLLEKYLKNLLQEIPFKIIRKWSGPILEPADGIALIGELRKNYFLASAFSGNGMTYSHISAMIFGDLILNRDNPWIELYDPKRIPSPYKLIKKGLDYSGELIDGIGRKFGSV